MKENQMEKKQATKPVEFARIPVKTVDEFLHGQEDGKLFGFYDIPEELYRPAPGHNWSTIKHRHIRKSAVASGCQEKASRSKSTGGRTARPA